MQGRRPKQVDRSRRPQGRDQILYRQVGPLRPQVKVDLKTKENNEFVKDDIIRQVLTLK